METKAPYQTEEADSAPVSSCDCISRVNDYLTAKYDAYIETVETMPLDGDFGNRMERVGIPTRKNKSGRPANIPIVATFCPFCGTEYRRMPEVEVAPGMMVADMPGTGTAERAAEIDAQAAAAEASECPDCFGCGTDCFDETCRTCGGTGKVATR